MGSFCNLSPFQKFQHLSLEINFKQRLRITMAWKRKESSCQEWDNYQHRYKSQKWWSVLVGNFHIPRYLTAYITVKLFLSSTIYWFHWGRILRLHPVDGAFILINVAEIFQQRTYIQFRAYARQEFNREPNFPHFLPSCLFCERELFGLKPGRITTSHRELAEYVRFKKVDLQFPLSNREWLLDPRMVQYRRAELFPATSDEYWYLGMWSRITRLPYRPHSEEVHFSYFIFHEVLLGLYIVTWEWQRSMRCRSVRGLHICSPSRPGIHC